MERTSTYTGLKLLWAARQFIQGKKFPMRNYESNEWRILTHDISELLTREDFIENLTEIDCRIYFQIVALMFTPKSTPC